VVVCGRLRASGAGGRERGALVRGCGWSAGAGGAQLVRLVRAGKAGVADARVRAGARGRAGAQLVRGGALVRGCGCGERTNAATLPDLRAPSTRRVAHDTPVHRPAASQPQPARRNHSAAKSQAVGGKKSASSVSMERFYPRKCQDR